MTVYWAYLLGSNLAAFDTEAGQWRSQDSRLELHLNTVFSPGRIARIGDSADPSKAAVEAAVRSFRGTILNVEGR